jgi:hypothetical protein
VLWWILGSICGLLVLGLVILVIVATLWDKRHRKTVMAKGDPIIAWIVQANDKLFKPGTEDYPAQVLISPDPAVDEDFMKDLIERVGDLKGMKTKDPVEAEVVSIVTHESYEARTKTKLPKDFTEGKEVYITGLMVERSLLPNGVLDEPYVHVQVLWDDPDSALYMLPYPKKKKRRREDD